MKSSIYATLVTFGLVSSVYTAEIHDAPKPNNLCVAPITTWIASGIHDLPVISLAYERQLSATGFALLIPIHFGYYSLDTLTSKSLFGAGIGIRKYIGRPFSGSYLTGQTDFMRSSESGKHDVWDPNLNQNVLKDFSEQKNTSITQLAFGYKFVWSQFVLDMSFGGGFYILDNKGQTFPTGAINLGFPFDAKTFGF